MPQKLLDDTNDDMPLARRYQEAPVIFTEYRCPMITTQPGITVLVLSRGRDIHSQDLSSGLQPAWLVKLLLSACHLLLHVLPQSTRLRNGIRVFTIGCIDVHKMRVLRASAPAEVLDLHDLQGITACQSSSGFCDRQERPIQYVQARMD